MTGSARLRLLKTAKTRRHAPVALCLTHFLLFGTAVEAQPAHKLKRAQPATTSRASPETTGTIASPPAKALAGKTPSAMLASVPDPSNPDEGELPPLFNLPSASRTRMRACGERWQQMKLDGEAGDEIWRDFANSCLAAKTDPPPAKTKISPEKSAQSMSKSGLADPIERGKR